MLLQLVAVNMLVIGVYINHKWCRPRLRRQRLSNPIPAQPNQAHQFLLPQVMSSQ